MRVNEKWCMPKIHSITIKIFQKLCIAVYRLLIEITIKTCESQVHNIVSG